MLLQKKIGNFTNQKSCPTQWSNTRCHRLVQENTPLLAVSFYYGGAFNVCVFPLTVRESQTTSSEQEKQNLKV